MKVLVTGAAGYIGSVVTDRLLAEGYEVVGFDSLVYGHAEAVDSAAPLIIGDLRDAEAVERTFADNAFDAVFHLAAEAYIDVSIADPGLFYAVNVQGGIHLLESMRRHGVQRVIFSSTAAVYGEPPNGVAIEDSPKDPVNAYGDTKLAFERALRWYHRSFGIRHVSFRYFNASGATDRRGEDRRKETHLIPILLQVALGNRKHLSLYGTDYPTPDGANVRDYVHVADIAQAHLLGLQRIDELQEAAFNLGSGDGQSNLQVIEAARRVTGHPLPYEACDRRPGDPAVLVASAERAKQVLGWRPEYTDIEEIVQTSWSWRQRHPLGYAG